jgi:vacuolar protein sorting-associated protein 13A/C
VDLDSIRTSQVLLKSGLRGFNLFVEVVPKDTRKLLLITSEVMIYNKTDQAVDLKFFECEGDTERNTFLQTVDAFRAISVPFDRTRAFVSFRFAGQHSQYSQMIDLAQIVDLREKTFECRHSDNQFTLMRCTKRGTNQTVLYLEPPYVIKNCLPNEIGYEIFSDEMGANAEHLAIDITSTNYTKHPYHNLKTVVKGQH